MARLERFELPTVLSRQLNWRMQGTGLSALHAGIVTSRHAEKPVMPSRDQVTLGVEVIVEGGVNREKSLR